MYKTGFVFCSYRSIRGRAAWGTRLLKRIAGVMAALFSCSFAPALGIAFAISHFKERSKNKNKFFWDAFYSMWNV